MVRQGPFGDQGCVGHSRKSGSQRERTFRSNLQFNLRLILINFLIKLKWVMTISYSIGQTGVRREAFFKLFLILFETFKVSIREMVGFHFGNGGRRCIRQILEKYQQGMGWPIYRNKVILKFRSSIIWRWKSRLYCAIKGRRFYNFWLSVVTDWISLWFKNRNRSWISDRWLILLLHRSRANVSSRQVRWWEK